MALLTLRATTVAKSIDFYVDRLWGDAIAAAIGQFFPLTNSAWDYILLYTIALTGLAVLFKKVLEWATDILDVFDFTQKETKT